MGRPLRSLDTYQVPKEMTMKVPTAQLEATNGPVGQTVRNVYHTVTTSPILVLIARINPTPAPLAIPLSRLLRAQGISPSRWKSSTTDIR